MRLKLADLPNHVIEQYNLRERVTKDGYIYLEIRQVMYVLLQTGILAQQQLENRLNKEGYQQSKLTPGLWTHTTRPICFTLCVENFGVKYVGKAHAQHLMTFLKQHCTISHDWTGKLNLDIDLDWDSYERKVHL